MLALRRTDEAAPRTPPAAPASALPRVALDGRLLAERDRIVRSIASQGVRLCSLVYDGRRCRYSTVVVAPSPDGRLIPRHPLPEFINPTDSGVVRARRWRTTPAPPGNEAARDALVFSPVGYGKVHPLNLALDLLAVSPTRVMVVAPALLSMLDRIVASAIGRRDLLNRVSRELAHLHYELSGHATNRLLWMTGTPDRVPRILLAYARLLGARARLLDDGLSFADGGFIDLVERGDDNYTTHLADLLELSRQPISPRAARLAEDLVYRLPRLRFRIHEMSRHDYYAYVDAVGPELSEPPALAALECIGKTAPSRPDGKEWGWRARDTLTAIFLEQRRSPPAAPPPRRRRSWLSRLRFLLPSRLI